MNSVKVPLILLALAVGAMGVVPGCASDPNGVDGSAQASATSMARSTQSPSRDAVKAEDIGVTVENGVVGGERRVLFSYSNNSRYPITDLRITYSLKPSVSDDEYESTIADMNTEWSRSLLDRTNAWNAIELSAEYYGSVDPGGESPQERVTLNTVYLSDMSQFDLFERSMMRICFLSDGRIYEETYDFKTNSYTLSKESIDTEQWLDTELSALIPRPEGQMVIETDSGTTYYSYSTFGTSEEEYAAYVAACKEMGFTDPIVDSDIRFYANTADGTYTIDVTPAFPHEGNMNVRIERND